MLADSQLKQILEKLPNERLAIAFSGGGDSTALVHICQDLRPKLLVLIVDHGLRPGSAAEAVTAQKFASGLGLEAHILTWVHDNPKTGLQEKARRARYGLMGGVCRAENIRYLLTGHTRDDQAETLLMRYEKNTGWRGAAGMAERTYAPVWPELAKVSIVRPLLGVSREDLRAYNKSHDLHWTEDPSNENEHFERIRARKYLAARPGLTRRLVYSARSAKLSQIAENKKLASDHDIQVTDMATISTARHIPDRLLGLCMLVAGGGDAPISPTRLKQFAKTVRQKGFNGATMRNAMCVVRGESLCFGPEPSSYKGRSNKRALQPIHLRNGEDIIWDGRFLLKAQANLQVWAAGEAPEPEQAEQLDGYPGPFKPAMPVTDGGSLGYLKRVQIVEERLNGFLGLHV